MLNRLKTTNMTIIKEILKVHNDVQCVNYEFYSNIRYLTFWSQLYLEALKMKREESSQSGCEVSSLCAGCVADYYISPKRNILWKVWTQESFHKEVDCDRPRERSTYCSLPRKRSAFSFLCRCVTVCLTYCQWDKGITLGFWSEQNLIL